MLPYHSHVSGKEVKWHPGSLSCSSSSSSSFCSSSIKMRSHSPSSHPPIAPSFCPPVLTELPQQSRRAAVLSGHSRAGHALLSTSFPALRRLLSSLAGSESHHLTVSLTTPPLPSPLHRIPAPLTTSPYPSPPHRAPHHFIVSLTTSPHPSPPHCLSQHPITSLTTSPPPSPPHHLSHHPLPPSTLRYHLTEHGKPKL